MFRFGKKIFQSLPTRLSIPSKGVLPRDSIHGNFGDKDNLFYIPSNFSREGNPMNL